MDKTKAAIGGVRYNVTTEISHESNQALISICRERKITRSAFLRSLIEKALEDSCLAKPSQP